jgi:hypothetical protein
VKAQALSPFAGSSMRARLLSPPLILLAALACNVARLPASSSPSSTATPGPERSLTITATPIRLVIPSGLAVGAMADTIDVVTENTGAQWDVAPAHLQLSLQGYSVETSALVPQVFVYPAQQYAGMNPAAMESLKRLQTVLSDPSASYNKDTLPRVPFLNAAQVLAAQQKMLHFSGGSGVRFVTQYGQDVSPINNAGLFYHFEGLSNDGKYTLIAILPVNLPFLAADNNPGSPLSSEGIPFPAPSASPDDYENYYKQISERINSAPVDQFSPPLDHLDKLIESITVSP